MSYQDSTKHNEDVGFIVNHMIDTDECPYSEILIYFNEERNEWIITKDRPFFSLGYKLEDVIATQEEEIKKLHNEINSLKSTIGQLIMQKSGNRYFKPIIVCPNCGNYKDFCICNKPHWKWNEITCLNKDGFTK